MSVVQVIEEGSRVYARENGQWVLKGTVHIHHGNVAIVPLAEEDQVVVPDEEFKRGLDPLNESDLLPDGYFAPDDAPKIPSPFLPDRRELPEGVEMNLVYGEKAGSEAEPLAEWEKEMLQEQADKVVELDVRSAYPPEMNNPFIKNLYNDDLWGDMSHADRAQQTLNDISENQDLQNADAVEAAPILRQITGEISRSLSFEIPIRKVDSGL